jgi:tetratricopeptide (TPR) repeat protein
VLLQNLPHPDDDRGLRIRLILRYPLANFPWEYVLVNDTGGEATANHFLGLRRNVSIVRHQENRAPSAAIAPASQPTKLVVALASPDTVQPVLQLDQERAAIEAAVDAYPDRLRAVYSQPATPDDLRGKLQEAHLFHFAGHGVMKTEASELFGKLEGRGELILDDGTGEEVDLGVEQLAQWLRDANTRVAVLGGCETARRDDRYVWSSVAAHLLNAGMAAVVGMQYKIGNKSATAFSAEFYNALLAGLPIDQAVANGRSAIAGASKDAGSVRDWGVPTLYLADIVDGVVFGEFKDNPALDPVRATIEVRVRQRVKELEGTMTAIKLGTVTGGSYEANQEADKVAKGAEMVGFEADSIGDIPVRRRRKTGEATDTSPTRIQVNQDVANAQNSKATGVEVDKVVGDVTIESTVNHVETSIVNGTYVDARTITNNVMTLGPDALDQIVGRLAALLGADKRMLLTPSLQPAPENVSRQIVEVAAAQKEVAARGVPVSAESLYRLGMLAAYDRDYTSALDYFRQATQADPDFADAFFAIAWLQQSLANNDLFRRDMDSAVARLAEARTAAMHTDPTDARALAQRGYIAKTLAQLAEARGQSADRKQYYEEAAHLFDCAAKFDPNEAGVQNGLGNVQAALGNLDAAIAAYTRAIDLAPRYTAAHHDLALAYEGRMKADPAHAAKWRKQAVAEWQKTYELAPEDPGFTPETIVNIGQRIAWLKQGGL